MDKIVYIIFISSVLCTSCLECEEECTELIFSENDISFLESYQLYDTLIFYSDALPNDTLVIFQIEYPDISPSKNNCFIQRKPSNSMSVYAKKLTKIIHQLNDLDKDSNVETKKSFWHFSITKTESPIEYYYKIGFENFYFYTDDIEKHNDSSFSNKDEVVYVFSHSYPDRLNDSLDIEKVFWSKKQGLIGYETLNGYEFKKINK